MILLSCPYRNFFLEKMQLGNITKKKGFVTQDPKVLLPQHLLI